MDELVSWLREQLDNDKRVASAAAALCGCHPAAPSWHFDDDENDGRIVTLDAPHPGVRRQLERRWNRTHGDMFAARHIALWDPKRALAEVDAKRRLLKQFSLRRGAVLGLDGVETGGVWDDLLRFLALPYADRAGYREEWRPAP